MTRWRYSQDKGANTGKYLQNPAKHGNLSLQATSQCCLQSGISPTCISLLPQTFAEHIRKEEPCNFHKCMIPQDKPFVLPSEASENNQATMTALAVCSLIPPYFAGISSSSFCNNASPCRFLATILPFLSKTTI